jgi:hypothetical protein
MFDAVERVLSLPHLRTLLIRVTSLTTRLSWFLIAIVRTHWRVTQIMEARFLLSLAILAWLGVPRAFAVETFDYTGGQYTLIQPGSPIKDLGTHLSGSVTLSCPGVCADGSYFYPGTTGPSGSIPDITDVQFTAGGLTLDSASSGVTVAFGFLTILNGAVTLHSFGLSSSSFTIETSPGLGDTIFGGKSISFDSVLRAAEHSGSWTGPTSSVGAPGPTMGTGVLPLLACFAGYLFWQRRRNPFGPDVMGRKDKGATLAA